jgi:hypothetical protein
MSETSVDFTALHGTTAHHRLGNPKLNNFNSLCCRPEMLQEARDCHCSLLLEVHLQSLLTFGPRGKRAQPTKSNRKFWEELLAYFP